jgi:predicted TIM-barrel fold metal-dependent hydrolase
MIIDAQVHVYERNEPGEVWANHLPGPVEMNGDQMIAAMDAAGVDAAILVSAWTLYRYDARFAVAARNGHPDRFALVKPLDYRDPAVAETIADWAATPGAVGVRIMMDPPPAAEADDAGVKAVLAGAARHALPVNLMCLDRFDRIAAMARAHPDCRLVIDHLGLMQGITPPPPERPFERLPEVLDLARFDNVAIKISGVCTLSHAPYPFDDLWEPLGRVFDAFGLERCMWGTDWTRAVAMVSYKESVDAFRLSDRLTASERDALMGGTLQRIYDWRPGAGSRPGQ